jgi:mono/diheme cytochrome c family protein
VAAVGIAAAALLVVGCSIRRNMFDQPKFEPYEKTDFFGDARSARPIPENTVAVGHLDEDTAFYQGMVDGEYITDFPLEVTAEVLARGRGRFQIYCTPCHGASGYGNGMIVKRGYKQPPSYHSEDLRSNPDKPVGYIYHTISNGFGVMSGYSYQLKPADRWAVVAYLRTLQFSQYAKADDLPEEDKGRLASLPEE